MPWGGIASAIGSVAGGLIGNASRGEDHYWDNYHAQKEFAQNGIRWKVSDAKAAGLHPLAALGSAGAFYTPSQSTGDPGQDYSWLADTGQQIGRAISAKVTAKERAEQQQRQEDYQAKQVERADLENQLLRQQIRNNDLDMFARASVRAVNTQQQVPAMPSMSGGPMIAGQAQAYPSGQTVAKPVEISTSMPGQPGIDAGTPPDIRFVRTVTGGYAPVRSKANEEALEDDWLGSLGWHMRNKLPAFLGRISPDARLLPDKGRSGKWFWSFNPIHQSFYPVHSDDGIFSRLRTKFDPAYSR